MYVILQNVLFILYSIKITSSRKENTSLTISMGLLSQAENYFGALNVAGDKPLPNSRVHQFLEGLKFCSTLSISKNLSVK